MDFKPTDLPIENQYPKLVRDRIPEKVANDGKVAEIKKLVDDEEYLQYLLKTMIEETVELQHSQKIGNMQEELADVFELIYAILKLKNWTIEDIITVQKEKREKNGGFDDRLIMLSKPN